MKALTELDELLLGGRGRKGQDRQIKDKLKRVVRKAPEVMVKVSGASKGGGHLKSHLQYIMRNGKIAGENERGDVLSGMDDIEELHKEWLSDGGKRKGNGKSRDSINLVLSMPEHTDPAAVKDAARDFAQRTFSDNHQYVFVLHTDEKHPHVHLTVKALGFDGTKLNPRKADLQRYREEFAQAMREQGVEAEATPRDVRGVTRKAKDSSLVHQIRRYKDGQTKGIQSAMPDVLVSKILEMKDEIESGEIKAGYLYEPWKIKIEEKREKVVTAYVEAAKELLKGGDAEDRKLAEDVFTFVKGLPPIKTEKDRMREVAEKSRIIGREDVTGKER